VLTGGDIQCSRHRVTPLRCMSVPLAIAVRVSVPVLSTVGLGSVGASPRAVRMSGLSVGILRSDFAMLQEGKGEETVSQIAGRWLIGHAGRTVPRSLHQQR
jgi:hypothetical protein